MQIQANQKGFSIIELLIVVIIIGIITAITIPSLLVSRRTSNEASAYSNLRTIHSAQLTYFSTFGSNSQYGDFSGLSTTAEYLDLSWTAPVVIKNTYTYTLTRGATNSKYCVSAISSDTSAKDFGVSSNGVIYKAAHGALTCIDGDLGGAIIVLGSN